VGKSTLFNVLTKMGIPAENFPFCTIEPNAVRRMDEREGGLSFSSLSSAALSHAPLPPLLP